MRATDFLRTIENLNAGPERDTRIVRAAEEGGLVVWPWISVPLDDERGYFRAAADYICIGELDDWVRVPIGAAAAQHITDVANAVLPAPYMVDLIWRAAAVKLKPIELGTTRMTSTPRFVEHHRLIEQARAGREGLIAGIKKDVVVSNKLELKPKSVCIFGWHRLNGEPIQKVSTKHESTYSDYSHGVRLIAPEMVLDGRTVRVQDVLRDPRVAAVLTGGRNWGQRMDAPNDGVLKIVRYGAQPARQDVPAPASETPTPKQPTSDAMGNSAADWCLRELAAGVKEDPPGSNGSPRIAEYFAPARRRGTEARLGIKAADWCAVAQCAALAAVTQPGQSVPHGYRAAVRELREDAQATGAWVPASELRSSAYRLQRGDLLVWKRGTGGLGHVARVDVPPQGQGFTVVTIGANEENAWKRRERRLDERELEGAISYTRFRPGLTLAADAYEQRVTSSPASASTAASASPPAPGQSVDAWARGVLLRAWERQHPGKPLLDAERQGLMAIARHERMYGLAKKPEAGIGKNNWGGVQCPGRGPCGPGCYPGGDKDAQGESYSACFKVYATPEDGAADMIRQVTTRRPHVWDALRSGDLGQVAQTMGESRVINGDVAPIYHETNPKVYGDALFRHAKELAQALGEPLFVRGSGTSAPVVSPSRMPVAPPAKRPPAPSPRPQAGTHQDGIRAIIASRRPDLARVVVGGHLDAQVRELHGRLDKMGDAAESLQRDCARADEAFARAMTAPHTGASTNVEVLRSELADAQKLAGTKTAHTRAYASSVIATSTSVVDYARRVDDYIRSLHDIVVEARKTQKTPDAFPWTDWAAFRVSWDMLYFDITHSMVLNFDEGTVNTYEKLARKWEDIIFQHYGRRPAVRPLVDQSLSPAKIAALAALGIGGAYLLSKAVG